MVGVLIPVVLVMSSMAGPAVLLAELAFVLAIDPVRRVTSLGPSTDRRSLNPVLKATARLSLVYAVLFAIGLVLGGGAG